MSWPKYCITKVNKDVRRMSSLPLFRRMYSHAWPSISGVMNQPPDDGKLFWLSLGTSCIFLVGPFVFIVIVPFVEISHTNLTCFENDKFHLPAKGTFSFPPNKERYLWWYSKYFGHFQMYNNLNVFIWGKYILK